MTGLELKQWIEDNRAEELEVWATDDDCGIYPVMKASVVTDDRDGSGVIATYIKLDE